MSSPTLQYRLARDPISLRSKAAGETGAAVDSDLATLESRFAGAESLDRPAYRDLEDAFLDGREENWDGYGAHPVSEVAFRRARTFLKQCLELYPAPVCGATPGGSLTLEWHVSPECSFLVSIGVEDTIAYAGILGSSTVRGTEPFVSEVPPAVWLNLGRLFPR